MASSALATKSFGDLEYASLGETLLLRWWNKIDESQRWHEGVFYVLCGAYAFVALIALVQLVRIQLRVPEFGWTTQKVFHLMNFVVNGLRAVEFGFYWSVFHYKPKEFGLSKELRYSFNNPNSNSLVINSITVLDMVLLDLPGLLFFSTYTLLVLFWAEIYHQARSLPADRLRPAYFTVNGAVYFLQVCIWIYMGFSNSPVAIEIAEIFFSVISLCAALGFITYGGSLFVMLRRFPIESRGRQKKLHEVGSVTGICCTCFLIRCVMVAVSAFNKKAEIHVRSHPILDLAYYMIVEIVPSALVLFILRKLPPRRVSDQYHPIN